MCLEAVFNGEGTPPPETSPAASELQFRTMSKAGRSSAARACSIAYEGTRAARAKMKVPQGPYRGLTIIGVLMILFGGAEVITGFTHKFLGISTAIGVTSTFLTSGIGTLYAVAGLLVVTMRRWAASLALACLVVVVAGRIALVVTGLFPLDSFEQTFAITVGTGIAASFAIYIGCKWRAFR